MSLMHSGIYDAFRAAGVPEDQARGVAETVAREEVRLARLEGSVSFLPWLARLEARGAVLLWLCGLNFLLLLLVASAAWLLRVNS
jgi:hypothetical protein